MSNETQSARLVVARARLTDEEAVALGAIKRLLDELRELENAS